MMHNLSINSAYLQEKTIKQLHDHFKQNADFPCVLLQKFFTDASIAQKEFSTFSKEVSASLMLQRCTNLSLSDNFSSFILSSQFLELVSKVFGQSVTVSDVKGFICTWKDYVLTKEVTSDYIFVIDLTESWDPQAGGNIVFRLEDGEAFTFPSTPNSLLLLKRVEGLHYFVQYCNHYGIDLHRKFIIGFLKKH